MNPEEWIDEEMHALHGQSAERSLRVVPEAGGVLRDVGSRCLNLSSNDYLNLGGHARVMTAAREALDGYGCGSGASRLVSGNLPIHGELEAALAAWLGVPAVLVFGSGFLANLGAVQAVVGRGDTVFADRLVHASIVDAMIGSRAAIKRFHHNDVDHLHRLLAETAGGGRKLVITESVFSMDGDLAPLAEIAGVADDHGALLMVDEAHALGVFGPLGAGRLAELGLSDRAHLVVGTLSKALGSYGGFVAGSDRMRSWLINRARSFIYTTAPPPPAVGAARGAIEVLREEPARGASLLGRANRFRHRLQEEHFDTRQSASHIIPVVIGDSEKALAVSDRLRDENILAVAMRPPTVPAGTSRLRLSISYAHTDDDLVQAADAIIRAMGAE